MADPFEPRTVIGGAVAEVTDEDTYQARLRARKRRRKHRKQGSDYMTLQQYQMTPKARRPQELIYGVFRAHDAPLVSHQRVVFSLARALQDHADARGLGEIIIAPIDVILDAARDLVVQPDVLFVSRAREAIVRDRAYGAPDLVVEVLSPRPRIGELDERVGWFASHGVREIWLYHQPDRRLDILTCADGAVSARASFDRHAPVRSAVLPEFTRTTAGVLGW
jgi:Uma2 family endonuclease